MPSGVEVLDFCFDFGSRAFAILRLKICSQGVILSQVQSQNLPNFDRDSRSIRNLYKEIRKTEQDNQNKSFKKMKYR